MPDITRISVDPRTDGVVLVHFTGRLEFTTVPEIQAHFAALDQGLTISPTIEEVPRDIS